MERLYQVRSGGVVSPVGRQGIIPIPRPPFIMLPMTT